MSDIYLDHWFENKTIRSNLYVHIRYHKKSFHLTSHVEYSLAFLPKKEDVYPERVLNLKSRNIVEILPRLDSDWTFAFSLKFCGEIFIKIANDLAKSDTLKRRRRLQRKPFSTKKCQQWLKSQTQQVIHISFYEFNFLCLNCLTNDLKWEESKVRPCVVLSTLCDWGIQ